MDVRTMLSEWMCRFQASYPAPSGLVGFPAAPTSAPALAASAFLQAGQHDILWIVPDANTLPVAVRDVHGLLPAADSQILLFPPAYQTNPKTPDLDNQGTRIRTLHRIAELRAAHQATLLVTSLTALLQPVPAPDQLQQQSLHLSQGPEQPIEPVINFLIQAGYDMEAEVLDKGQVARRGGIIDLWTPDMDFPIRIEWFGDEIDSLRFFDPISQRTIEPMGDVHITPVQEPELSRASLLDHIPEHACLIWSDLPAARDTDTASLPPIPAACDPARLWAENTAYLSLDFSGSTPPDPPGLPVLLPIAEAVRIPATSGITQLSQARERLLARLRQDARNGYQVLLFFDTPGTRDHFTSHLLQPPDPGFQLQLGSLSEGCTCPAIACTLVADPDIYGRKRFPIHTESTAKRARRYTGSRIQDYTDMEPGDLVVHSEHGVGRYLGVQNISFHNRLEEVLAIEYADEAKLYVPVSHAHLLSRYVGMAGHRASLHRLGGKRWHREKSAAHNAIMDLAADMLELQARRNLLQGHAFAPDTPEQHEFDQAFPFEETDDQLRVIAEVKADMEARRPMDRLICGDAGYGKTEVAMRAAFKAVQDHYQVAVLVPTTVLAQQHFQTFSERMSGFDVRIGVLSRFQTHAQRKRIQQQLELGTLDIVIGTHSLVQPRIRFANLGLVMIDEEQRFGVKHKERLKSMRALVDVLTLSATPIPRTLYMSMTGARDLSLLRTAPRDRVPIETTVTNSTDATIAKAIRYEHSRGGQVYFLHNRVVSIQRLRDRLSAMVPDVRIEMAHGRMHPGELASVMSRFASGSIDVLLCTTIIESGVDIPRANTILIDRADRFGIADLYQLRGRVGRGDRKAYAYLLLPPHGIIDRSARERLRAIQQHGGLGAGFNLAIKDMEIRGAGNILGAAQSGHICSIGFGLYCQLLQRAIARLKGLPVPDIDPEIRLDFISTTDTDTPEAAAAHIPSTYIPEETLRMSAYRRIAEAQSEDQLDALQAELQDRFGPVPAATCRLVSIAKLRCLAAEANISSIEVRKRKVLLHRQQHLLTLPDSGLPRIQTRNPDSALAELSHLLQEVRAVPATIA